MCLLTHSIGLRLKGKVVVNLVHHFNSKIEDYDYMWERAVGFFLKSVHIESILAIALPCAKIAACSLLWCHLRLQRNII